MAVIKIKGSSTPGAVPSPSSLEVRELAVNTADGKLFTKHSDNTVKELGGIPIMYGTGNPPSASGVPEGTVYFQYE